MKNNRISAYYILPILTYFSISILSYLTLYYFNFIDSWPNATTLNSGDTGFYQSIMREGYQTSGKFSKNPGFFPLFSYFWRLTQLDILGISVLNCIIYLTSLSLLCKILRPNHLILGLFMASPYMFFMWSPLSEPLFFLFCIPILYGIIEHKWKLIFAGALLASMTRPIFLFFIPAFVGMSLMSHPINKILSISVWRKIILHYLLPCFIGVGLVIIFQYYQTGKWMIYFETQSTVWGRTFNYGPIFPLGYNTPFWNLQGSYISFWIGSLTGLLGLKLLFDWFRQKEILQQIKDYELFSVIFISMSLMSILFFNAAWSWNEQMGYGSTHFTGINRYIHPTVFFLVILNFFFRLKKLSLAQYVGIFLLTNLLWFAFDLHYYRHIQRYLAFGIPNLVVISLILFHAYRWKILGYGLIAASFILQGILFNYHLSFIQVD